MMAGRGARGKSATTEGAARHIPVLLAEVIASLGIGARDTIIDATFGAGGYTRAILAAGAGRVLAIDRDPSALALGDRLLQDHPERLILVEGRFSHLDQLAKAHGIVAANGVVLDVGVSSMQLDDGGRGFSFQADGPLDMRMSASGITAADIIARASETALADIIFRLGEERHARRVARAIVATREAAAITTTASLAAIVRRSIPHRRDQERDPATRTFQALRIVVNDELGELADALAAAERILAPGGRLVVVTFHSLEDRIVKRYLAAAAGRAGRASRHAPPIEQAAAAPRFLLVNQRPLTPSDEEITANPRARSARLRAALRTDAPAALAPDDASLGVIRPRDLLGDWR